jgi:hypothetical protein
VDWEIHGHHLDTYPLIHMGTIMLWLTIVCSRKHAPFPTSNKLATSGDEKEITYAQATQSLRVVPIDIQHKLKVLYRFIATHEPLVKALFSFKNIESHGELINITRNFGFCNYLL